MAASRSEGDRQGPLAHERDPLTGSSFSQSASGTSALSCHFNPTPAANVPLSNLNTREESSVIMITSQKCPREESGDHKQVSVQGQAPENLDTLASILASLSLVGILAPSHLRM